MAPPPETWLSQRLREGADTLQVPFDLTDVVVNEAIQSQSRSKRIHSAAQVAAVVAVVAFVVLGVSVIRSKDTQTPTPADSPTPNNTMAPITDRATALLGTWELVVWEGEPVRRSKGMPNSALATFQTDGTWEGYDGCNFLNGTYRVRADGNFVSTINSTTYAACPGMTLPAMPAVGAVRVSVDDDAAIFLDASDEPVAKYRRPGGQLAAEARVVTRPDGAALALSTYGSGSCPTRMASISLDGDGQLMVQIADSPDTPCTADFRRSTDVMTLPDGVDLSAPLTATLVGRQPRITLLVDTPAGLGEPLLVVARNWDGGSVRTARLEGTLGANEQGCVTVGGTVVMWPSTYHLVTDRADMWAIATTDERYGPGYMNVLATEGESVVLAGHVTPFQVRSGPLPTANHSECLLDNDYWTGIIELPPND